MIPSFPRRDMEYMERSGQTCSFPFLRGEGQDLSEEGWNWIVYF